MTLSSEKKRKAFNLRKKGYSLKEISDNLGIAKSTSSLWLRNFPISLKIKKKLLEKQKNGREKGILFSVKKKEISENFAKKESIKTLQNINLNKNYCRLICALLYWCEGGKYDNGVFFTNSDPKMIRLFLKLFRKSFVLDENKFRVCLHLHKYHFSKKQIEYWSNLTNISKKQFTKPYQKNNTGKRVRKNYQGCVSVRYHDVNILRQIQAIINTFIIKMGP